MKLEFFDRLPSYKAAQTSASLLTPYISNDRLPRPFIWTFVVTRRCNSRCKMCNIWEEKDSPLLSLDQIRHMFGKDDFSFIRQMVLTGGEPTMRSDLPELFEIVREACPGLERVELATSGLNTRRTLDHVRRMLETVERSPGRIKHFVVQVSVDGIGEMHDDIRGIAGFFGILRKTLDGLAELEEHYPILSRKLSCVLMPRNLGQVEPLRAMAREMRIPIYFSPVVMSGAYYRNLDDGGELTFVSGEGRNGEAVQVFEALARDEPSGVQFYYGDVSRMLQGARRGRTCMMGYFGCILEYDGNVYPCVNYEMNSFGNLLEKSFDEIWFGPQARSARGELRRQGCPTCVSMCYTLPVNAGEVIQLAAQRIGRRLGRSSQTPESEHAHAHTPGLLGQSELEP